MKRKILFFSLMLTFLFASCSNLIDELTVTKEKETNYTVTISDKIENGTVTANPTTAAAGTEITLSVTPATGYQFATLSVTDAGGNAITVTDSKFTMPKSNVTVSATFTALPPETAEYTVKHLQQNIDDDNYTLKESETKTGTVGQPTAASAKSYYGFTAQTVTQVTVAASGTVVEIKYDRNTYTVTFDSNGGSDVSSQSLRYEAKATEPAQPTKTATASTEYTFEGWYSDSGLESAFSFDTAIKKDITLYAKWTETAVITYIGTKAPSEAKAVGDIVFSDGSATPYSTDLTLSAAQKEAAVAVIYYAGSSAEDVLGAKTLGVGLKNTGTDNTLAWARHTSDTDEAEGYSTDIMAIQCTPSESGSGKSATATFTGDLNGSDNWQALCDAVSDEETSGNYPAWEWVNAYATENSLAGSYANGWYLPTVAELCMLYREKDTVNSALEKAGGTKIADEGYWSSSQGASIYDVAWNVWFDDGYLPNINKDYCLSVCAVRDFSGADAPKATAIGIKSKPDAVGDIVFSDGSATHYTADLTLTEEQKSKAVAVIFYAGSASDTLGAKTLGVGLKNATGDGNALAWAWNEDEDTNITAIQCTPSPDGEGAAATATFSGDTDGSDNWKALCDAVSDEGTSGNYPAWEWVNAYATTANLTGDYASGWYLPTVAELSMLYREKATVNSALEKAGGTEIADTAYWSSSQVASLNVFAWVVWFNDGYLGNNFGKGNDLSVCTVRAF